MVKINDNSKKIKRICVLSQNEILFCHKIKKIAPRATSIFIYFVTYLLAFCLITVTKSVLCL